MGIVRTATTRLMSMGVPGAGWYAIFTGLALLFVAYVLGTVADDDAAAPFVAVALAVLGAWQLERRLRTEFQRRPKRTDDFQSPP